MKRVLLAVITEGDVTLAHFCSSLVQSVKEGLAADVELFPVFPASEGNWPMAFNKMATIAWQEKLDGLLCISPRVSWSADSLLALVNTDKDAVAMPVATKAGFQVQLGEIARLQEDESTGEVKVRGTSLEFFYLSSYALDRLCTTHPLVNYRGQEVKLLIQSGDIYDSYFDPADILAYRLREQGIEIWLSTKHTAHRQDVIEYPNDFSKVLVELKANG